MLFSVNLIFSGVKKESVSMRYRVKSLLFCFSLFFLLNKIIADFSVSPSEVKVIKSFIIQYLFHSSNAVDELEQKLKAYTMSTELQLHINLQIDQI